MVLAVIDRTQAERLARTLAQEMTATLDQETADSIQVILDQEIGEGNPGEDLATSERWRNLVWRALESAELAG